MANLRDRLSRIKDLNKHKLTVTELERETAGLPLSGNWEKCGFKVLKRNLISELKYDFSHIHFSISILIPDILGSENIKPEKFIFFDLETTGLGGSGTVAFLASFGSINKENNFVITQYLLLDYPGEIDFLNLITAELENENSMIVTYNGKSFDCQIVKSRCWINRLKTPLFKHADLLHPARRLWKSIIQDCSQSSVESKIIGIDRVDDIPGSLAPEIWFEFLKTGNTERLIGICNHNIYDIKGLASIFEVIMEISNRFENCKYKYDIERTAISFYKFAYQQMKKGHYEKPLELIDIFINLLPDESYWKARLNRRKVRLMKIIN